MGNGNPAELHQCPDKHLKDRLFQCQNVSSKNSNLRFHALRVLFKDISGGCHKDIEEETVTHIEAYECHPLNDIF